MHRQHVNLHQGRTVTLTLGTVGSPWWPRLLLRRCSILDYRCRRLACTCQAVELAVVGGGAAGLTAAYFAASAGAQVVVLEKNMEAGRKILISGGTRCNVLPQQADPQRDFFTESSQSALRAVLATWTLESCHSWLSDNEHLGLPLSLEPETAKWFPRSNSAQDVRDALVAACRRRGAAFRFGAGLRRLRRLQSGGWACETEAGEVLAQRVVLATGGMSFPKLGATGIGYQAASDLGHTLHPPYPALTPLLGRHPGGQQLAGVSLYSAQLSCVQQPGATAGGQASGRRRAAQRAVRAERSAMLFTHRGYSGPAVLDLSHHLVKEMERGATPPELVVDWTGEGRAAWEQRLAVGGSGLAPNLLRKHGLPQRLAEALCLEAGLPLDRRLSELKKAEREHLLTALTRYPLPVSGHEAYPKAEVTGGGVPLNEVDCSTLESRLAPGLHLCGEVLDVFGRIGGFNFYWAWVTGRAAGRAAAAAAVAGRMPVEEGSGAAARAVQA